MAFSLNRYSTSDCNCLSVTPKLISSRRPHYDFLVRIYQNLVDICQFMVNNMSMLEGIFGNKTAEKVLLYIYHHGEGYALGISRDLKISHNPVVQQLDRFEKAQVLISKMQGRTRVYKFNDKHPFTSPVKELIERAYRSMTIKQREALFRVRRRPRQKGKPVIEGT